MKKLMLTSALTVLFMAGCCSPSITKTLDRAIASNLGHMADEDLPEEARAIAEDNYDVHWKVKAALDSDVVLPADVAARQAAREADIAAVTSESEAETEAPAEAPAAPAEESEGE
jgi:hypothetical protein